MMNKCPVDSLSLLNTNDIYIFNSFFVFLTSQWEWDKRMGALEYDDKQFSFWNA